MGVGASCARSALLLVCMRSYSYAQYHTLDSYPYLYLALAHSACGVDE